jgi:outer membrane protein OmpA-like peptidoglycan-associated protein
MKTKSILILTAAALFSFGGIGFAQQTNNLVINGSFEKTDKKVKGWGAYRQADGLSSSNNTTVDLYSVDACGNDYDVPNNYMGDQGSKEGNNYAGIIAYMADDAGFLKTKPGYRKYSEYIQMSLAEPLVAGKAYVITFSASLAEKSAYAVSGLGVYFTSDKLDVSNNAFLDVVPHVITTEIVTGMEWTTFTGTYVANGGERFVTLGCFNRYMEVQKIVAPNTNNSRKAYYFIDDVSLSPQIVAPPSDDMISVLTGSCYRLEDLNFETDKAVILATSYDELNSLARFLKTYPYLVVYVDGHTDKTGTDAHNDKLSEDRAAAVRTYLTDKGISGDRLKVRGYGESQPIDLGADNSLANRRVEITICAATTASK